MRIWLLIIIACALGAGCSTAPPLDVNTSRVPLPHQTAVVRGDTPSVEYRWSLEGRTEP